MLRIFYVKLYENYMYGHVPTRALRSSPLNIILYLIYMPYIHEQT